MKKFIFVVIVMISSIIMVLFAKKSEFKQELRPITSLDYVRLAETIRDSTTNQLALHYKLSPSGYGGGGGAAAVCVLSFDFDTDKSLSLEEMRVLLVNSEEALLRNMNLNMAIRPYLLRYPFSPSGGEVAIFSTIDKEELKMTRRPTRASIHQEKIYYTFIRPEADTNQTLNSKHYETISETYEEARNKVIQEGKLENIALLPEFQPPLSPAGLPKTTFYKSTERRREEYSGPSEEREMQKVVDKFGEELAKKNDLIFHCVGSATVNTYTWYSLIFHDFQKRTLDEGRLLAANLFKEFFAQLSNTPLVHQYNTFLNEYYAKSRSQMHLGPDLTPEQVGFQITSWDENMEHVQKPFLSQIMLDRGVFYYYETDPATQELRLVFKESLAEAKALNYDSSGQVKHNEEQEKS